MSSGQRQRLSLAAALARPSSLLLDEPEQSLNAGLRLELAAMREGCADKDGTAYLEPLCSAPAPAAARGRKAGRCGTRKAPPPGRLRAGLRYAWRNRPSGCACSWPPRRACCAFGARDGFSLSGAALPLAATIGWRALMDRPRRRPPVLRWLTVRRSRPRGRARKRPDGRASAGRYRLKTFRSIRRGTAIPWPHEW